MEQFAGVKSAYPDCYDLGFYKFRVNRYLLRKHDTSSASWLITSTEEGLAFKCFPISYKTAYHQAGLISFFHLRGITIPFYVFSEAECDGCTSETDEGRSIGELLLPQYTLATGGLAKDHRPVITFPDKNNFHLVSPQEYRRLLLYLTSVPS